uniref:Uncharacterized protein n=1 Tax=Anguilla anguilla TaxID=7936 RepID=A0A0E9QX06_ANGAN
MIGCMQTGNANTMTSQITMQQRLST